MANSSQRDQKILAILQRQGSASIQSLAEALSVSLMTVHRDLNRLAAAGAIVKTHGGASMASSAAGAKDACAMCGKTVSERTVFILHLNNGEQRRACCAHCGLMLQEETSGVKQSMTADLLHPHVVSARQATYVAGSGLTVCCAPSVLSFGSEEEARKFREGFGGALVDMNGAVRFLKKLAHSA